MSNAYEVYGIFEGFVRLRDGQGAAQNPSAAKSALKADKAGACAYCGAPLISGSKFCNECGEKAEAVSEKTAEQLRRLKQFAEEGVLTKEEYEAKKSMLLGGK